MHFAMIADARAINRIDIGALPELKQLSIRIDSILRMRSFLLLRMGIVMPSALPYSGPHWEVFISTFPDSTI